MIIMTASKHPKRVRISATMLCLSSVSRRKGWALYSTTQRTTTKAADGDVMP
jgi:hypothetical protein